ncbi:unnamed protein product [Paramecium sonneborni]|uniref:Transmembrane protein n=1 Tax=Paramecium sonneborni TaxID=65129 RepID=A0A8S1RRH0_9CILI|nr:unnamed protein product [Paramecium sonneborni]
MTIQLGFELSCFNILQSYLTYHNCQTLKQFHRVRSILIVHNYYDRLIWLFITKIDALYNKSFIIHSWYVLIMKLLQFYYYFGLNIVFIAIYNSHKELLQCIIENPHQEII